MFMQIAELTFQTELRWLKHKMRNDSVFTQGELSTKWLPHLSQTETRMPWLSCRIRALLMRRVIWFITKLFCKPSQLFINRKQSRSSEKGFEHWHKRDLIEKSSNSRRISFIHQQIHSWIKSSIYYACATENKQPSQRVSFPKKKYSAPVHGEHTINILFITGKRVFHLTNCSAERQTTTRTTTTLMTLWSELQTKLFTRQAFCYPENESKIY